MMHRTLSLLALLMVVSTAVHAGNALMNGDFALAGDQPTLAADWTWSDNSGWSRSADLGLEGKPCLAFSANKPAGGIVTQRVSSLQPGFTYVLRVVSRGNGQIKPALRLLASNDHKEVIPAVSLALENEWEVRRVVFLAPGGGIDVEIAPDASVLNDGKGVVGEVCVASVEIRLGSEQEPAQVIPKLGENLALGRPYTLTPKPDYALCTDPDDKTQITDGVYTENGFWTRPTTVGWGGTNPEFLHFSNVDDRPGHPYSGISYNLINIDLGQDYPVKGVAYSTAGGISGVRWPLHLYVFVSPDGKAWHRAGDLVSLSTAHDSQPLYGEYATRRYWTDSLHTHGRYVQVVAAATATYTAFSFVDEIEVYRGDDTFMAAAYADAGIDDVQKAMAQDFAEGLIRQQLRKDLRAVEEDVAVLPVAQKPAFNERVGTLKQLIDKMPAVAMEGFKAILPMLPLETDIFALQGEVWRAQGKAPLRIWGSLRWDPLEPSQEPPPNATAPAITVNMMSNEYRAGVVNFTNAGDRPVRLNLRLTGLPGGTNPDYATVCRVEHVGSRLTDSVAAALPEVKATPAGYPVEVPAGMTRQVWFTFNPRTVKSGTYNGNVEISGAATLEKVPVKLAVWPLRFPDRRTLSLGGWDYTNTPVFYGITSKNVEAVVAYLKEHYVNMPWASSAPWVATPALPAGAFDAAGNMSEPDTSAFDDWLSLWPKANMYGVFLAAPDNLNGVKMGTDLFNTMVGNWAHFWAKHARDKGLKPSQLALLIYDEPNNKSHYDIIVAWGKAIKTAEPELCLYEDPQPMEPGDVGEMLSLVDIIAPGRPQYLTDSGGWRQKLYDNLRQQGKDISFYTAEFGIRAFDPYSLYLLQEWHVFASGGSNSGFWAFSDNGGVDCWNEYPAKGYAGPSCPYYLSEDGITGAKYMEAIREGVEDYEYLSMLKRRVAELEKKGVAPEKLAGAKALLVEGPRRVLAEDTTRNYRWDAPKQRDVQDQVRVELLKALVDLQKL